LLERHYFVAQLFLTDEPDWRNITIATTNNLLTIMSIITIPSDSIPAVYFTNRLQKINNTNTSTSKDLQLELSRNSSERE
jgi:hypothetical protein